MPAGAAFPDTDLLRRYGRTMSFGEAAEVLLEDVRDRTPFDRPILVAFAGEWTGGRGADVGQEDVADLVLAMQSRLRKEHEGVLFGDWPRAATLLTEMGIPGPPSFQSPLLVPLITPDPAVLGGVVVDAMPGHPALADVADCLQIGEAVIARFAELESLHARVGELESQRARARRVLDTLPDPVLVMDEEARVLLANRRAEDLLTVNVEDNPGRRHAVETNNLFFSAFRARAVLGGDVRGGDTRELLMVDPVDGSDLLFEVFHRRFTGHGPDTESMIYILRDITDLKRVTLEVEAQFNRSIAAEHQARRESERLNVVIENAGVPILVTDHRTDISLMNHEAERLFEVTGQAQGASPRVRDIRANNTKLTGMISDFLLQPLRRREDHLKLVDPDGAREFPAKVVGTKILNTRGEPTAVVSVLHDLTQEAENERLARELRQLNEELEERIAGAIEELARRNAQLEAQRAELERASRLKSEFLATMSHELRTPINAMLGYNSLLEEGLFGPLSDRQKDPLDRMRGSAEHLLSIINDILDLSKVEAGKVVLHPSDLDLEEFARKVSETGRLMTRERSLEYRLEVEPGLPVAHLDETRLRQVLLNLLSNAVKFTEEGSVTLRVRRSAGSDRLLIEVADTGIGIAKEELEAIFEEFRQVDQSITRQHGGAGLGLAISRKLIALMGGTLTVESVRGEGTTFRVDLPVRSSRPLPSGAEPPAPARVSEPSEDADRGVRASPPPPIDA